MNELIAKLDAGLDLDPKEIHVAAGLLLDEAVPADKKAAFLKALAAKGEAPSEIAAFVEAFLDRAVDPGLSPASLPGPMLDVCGTGGDKLNLFNVSTTGIFILAAGGVSVVKHGNRGMTSKSGGADVLEALGIKIDLEPDRLGECVKQTGAGFLFAPLYHPAFKAVAPVRKQLAQEGARTVFNLLGPLLNPARPSRQLVGVFSPDLPPVFAEILSRLGRENAWAVHGTTAEGDPMDEFSTTGPTSIAPAAQEGRAVEPWIFQPGSLKLNPASLVDLRGGDARENADILVQILNGTDRGPRRELVLLNAAAGLVVAGRAPSLEEGFDQAAELVDRGAALERMQRMQSFR